MRTQRCGLTGLLMLLLLVSRSRGGINDVKNRAIDFFSLLKNHLLPQRPAAPSADASPAHRTVVRGNCLHEYYAIHARQPLTIKSTNYPGPYPPNECRKMLLLPADQHTSVVLVCTDIDTFAIGVLGEVSGDMLEFPGGVVNRRVDTMYGIDVTQCAAVPFTRRTPPGQALKVGFFSDDFVQRRGFSCQAWGESVDEAEGLRPANVGLGGAVSGTDQEEKQQQHHLQQQEASHIHQQGAQVHNRQPNQQAQHQAQHQQFQPQQVQHQPQHQHLQEQQEVFQQHQHQDEEQAHQFFQNQAVALSESFAQVMPLLRLPGYRPSDQQRRPLNTAPRPQRPPQFAGLQAFADLFGGGRRRVRGGSNRTGRRVRGPRRPTGHVRFPGDRHKRSLADLLRKRLLILQARDRDVTARPSTTTTTLASVVSAQSEDEPLEAGADVGGELGLFKPPEHIEYIFTPLRKPPPFDPKRVGNSPMFLRVPITRNTTESPLVEVPYVVTPQTITLRATTDAGQVLTRLFHVGKDMFPTTPKPGLDGYKTSRPKHPTSPQVVPERLETKRTPVTTAPQGVLERIDVTDGLESTLQDDTDTLGGDDGVADNVVVVPVFDDAQSLDEALIYPGSDVKAPDDGALLDDDESIGDGASIVVEGVTEDNERVVEEVHAPEIVAATGDPSSGAGHAVQDGHVEGEDSIDCGVAGPAVQGRVFGGEDALPGSYPWVVYLISDAPLGPEKTVYCTGSLISRRWILTAAHCVDYARTTDVHMGYLDVSKETNLTLRVNATKYRVHRYWTRLAKDHDVALIELPDEVTVSESVRPICLPRRSQVGNTYEDARAEICGWGKTYTDQVGGSFVLQRAEVAVRSNCDCMASFPISVTPLKICSHGRFHSPCQGDSGGPLQVRGASGRYSLVGVSSFTSSLGCDVGMPAIYTRVTAYLDWIEENSGLVVPL